MLRVPVQVPQHVAHSAAALVYCMEFLESNFSWLRDRIDELDGRYLVFDLPGQVELYTHHNALHNLLVRLQRELDVRVRLVQPSSGSAPTVS